MDAKQTEIAEKIKGILVESLRIPADELTYESELFGDEIGLDSIDSLPFSCSLRQTTHRLRSPPFSKIGASL